MSPPVRSRRSVPVHLRKDARTSAVRIDPHCVFAYQPRPISVQIHLVGASASCAAPGHADSSSAGHWRPRRLVKRRPPRRNAGRTSWPSRTTARVTTVDLSLIHEPGIRPCRQALHNTPDDGWCALHDPADGFFVAMLFPVESVPYVGLSINLGGWPLDRPAYYNVGLEPCNGYPDRLDVAVEKGAYAVAAPSQTLTWQLEIHAGRCADVPSQIRTCGKRDWRHEHDQGHRRSWPASRPPPSHT